MQVRLWAYIGGMEAKFVIWELWPARWVPGEAWAFIDGEWREVDSGLFLSRSFSRAAHLSSFISFFVRSQSPFLRPDPPQRQAAAHRSCQGWSPLRRPPTGLGLDSSEHGGTIECSRAGSAR